MKKALEEGDAGDYSQTQIRFRGFQNKFAAALVYYSKMKRAPQAIKLARGSVLK